MNLEENTLDMATGASKKVKAPRHKERTSLSSPPPILELTWSSLHGEPLCMLQAGVRKVSPSAGTY